MGPVGAAPPERRDAAGPGLQLLGRAAELGGSTVPSAVGLLLFQQCRQETIQGNDYYIILKEYGWEKAEAAPSHVVRGDRSLGRPGDARAGRGLRLRALGARGGDPRGAVSSSLPCVTRSSPRPPLSLFFPVPPPPAPPPETIPNQWTEKHK